MRGQTDGALLDDAEISGEAAEGGEGAGGAGDDDLFDAIDVGQPGAVHGAAAAEGDQGAVAAVDAALHRHAAQGAGHGGVGDGDDSEGGVHHAEAERFGNRRERTFGTGEVERDAVAEAGRRVEVAEDGVGIGDRGQGAAAAVARRAGLGAGAVGPDRQAAGAEADDGATARADGVHGQHRQSQRPAGQHARVVISAEPSTTRHTSVVVPPMSKVSARGRPSRGPIARRRRRRRRGQTWPW